jgi:uncharacterized SAM-dependent methyltransferase
MHVYAWRWARSRLADNLQLLPVYPGTRENAILSLISVQLQVHRTYSDTVLKIGSGQVVEIDCQGATMEFQVAYPIV